MNLIKPSFRRSLSLIEPVKEEDENVLMDEIDQLAKQRNSSLAPIQFRNTIKALPHILQVSEQISKDQCNTI